MKRFAFLVILLLYCFPVFAVRLKSTSGNLYESRNPFEYQRFVRVGNSISSQKGDIFDFNYNSKKMTWKDHKGKSVYQIEHIEYYDNITIFSTKHHFVKVTQEGKRYTVEIVFKGGTNSWYLLNMNCIEI